MPTLCVLRDCDALQRSGLPCAVVDRPREALGPALERADPVGVFDDRVDCGPFRARRVALGVAAGEQFGDPLFGLLAGASCAFAGGVISPGGVELVEYAAELRLGEALAGEVVAGVLELLVVVDREIQDAAGLVDVLADLLGVADRVLLMRSLESPIKGVHADNPYRRRGGDDGGRAVVQVSVALLMLLIRCLIG